MKMAKMSHEKLQLKTNPDKATCNSSNNKTVLFETLCNFKYYHSFGCPKVNFVPQFF